MPHDGAHLQLGAGAVVRYAFPVVPQGPQMSGDYLFAVGTIGLSKCNGRKPSTLLQAARHNRRAIQAEQGARGHIDPARMVLNETLAGPATPTEVDALAKTLMAGAGVDVARLRKDYTQAIEVLFSLPPDTAIDDGQYFRRCVEWAGQHFGVVNILSADIHRDESAPHCHVLVLPLVNNKMVGSALKGRKETAAMRESFYSTVAKSFGLTKPVGRLVGAARGQAARAVHQALETMKDGLLHSALREAVNRMIERDPAPYMAALGIALDAAKPAKQPKTMAEIFTSPGKGAKTIAIEQRRGKTIAIEKVGEKYQSLPCVVFGKSTPSLPHHDDTEAEPSRAAIGRQAMHAGATRHQAKTVAAEPDADCVRVRDPEFDLSAWECSTEPTSFHSQH